MLYGNHQEILRPVDSNEHRCGNDSEVRDRPYLLYHNLSECLNLHNVVLGCKSKSVSQICKRNTSSMTNFK